MQNEKQLHIADKDYASNQDIFNYVQLCRKYIIWHNYIDIENLSSDHKQGPSRVRPV